MRNRSRVSSRKGDCASVVSAYAGGVVEWNPFYDYAGYYGNNLGPSYTLSSSISDETTAPGHRRVPLSCDHTQCTAALFDSRLHFQYPAPTADADVKCVFPWLATKPISLPAFPADALVDTLASLVEGSIKTNLSLPIFLLEGAKTIGMLRNPFNLLKPSFRKRVGRLSPAQLLKRGADIWLEHLYGWKQFKSDVDGISVATAKFLNSYPALVLEDLGERLSASSRQTLASGGEEYTAGCDIDSWNYYSGLSTRWSNGIGGFFRLVGVHTVVDFRLSCRHYQSVSYAVRRTKQLLALTSSVPNWQTIRDTIWELVPFSFLVDWFVDTRGIWYLSNVGRLSEVDVKDVCYSTHLTKDYYVEWLPEPALLYYMNATEWGYKLPVAWPHIIRSVGPGRYSRYVRTPGFPTSDGIVTSALTARGLTWSQLATGASLIAQRIF